MRPESRIFVVRWLLLLPLLGLVHAPAAIGMGQTEEPAVPISVVASGLTNPRGMAWDEAGILHVAQAGTGATETAVGAAASVVRVDGGCPRAVVSGLPSTRGMTGAVQGPSAVAFLDGTLYVLQDEEADRGDLIDTFPNAVYAATPDGGVRLVANVSTWLDSHPTKEIPKDRGKLAETFGMIAGDGFLWVVESNEGQVLKVTPDGAISRVADLSTGHPVPTAIAPAPDGGVYVGNLTTPPYADGAAKVVKVTADGTVSDAWTGLTMVTGLAVGRDGSLFALEMSTGNSSTPPFIQPGSGRVVKQIGPDQLIEVVSPLDFPIGLATGPDGDLYVSFPALGSSGPAGAIVRIDPTSAYLSPPEDLFKGANCPGFTAARAALAAEEAKMTAAEAATTPAPTARPVANAVPVTIKNFAFTPLTVTIPAGTTITWTNRDAIAHTATADDKTFDSGNLNPGQSFSFTFDKPGTYSYICTYHPFMKGTIIVTGEAVSGGQAAPPSPPATATEAAPAPAETPVSTAGVTIVASGLHSPRGMAWTADGTLYVAQSGTGQTATSTGAAASIVRIDGGCPSQLAAGLPSTEDPYKDVMGPQDIALLAGKLYVVEASTSPLAEMDPKTPNGIYEVQANGTPRLVADLTSWILANPTAYTPGDANARGEPYKILPGDGFLWVLESNRGEVLKVTEDGQVTRVADLSEGHLVFAGFALAPGGGVYVGTLTPAPHADGAAKVMKVTEDGQVSDVWVNLTTVTGIMVGKDGTLYATEMSTGDTAEGGLPPGSGRLVKQTGADQSADVAINLDYPVALRLGPDGMAYIALPAYGQSDQAGMIVRVDLSAPQPMALDVTQAAVKRCPAAESYVAPGPGAASPVPFPVGTRAAG